MSVKCPRCFHPLPTDRYAWQCAGACQPGPDPIASAHAGLPMVSRPMWEMQRPPDARTWPAPGRCARCNGPMVEICTECHYALLPQWRESETVTVALAGARATGKSVYVAVLVKQLEQMFIQAGLPMIFADAHSRRVYEHYYQKPLYEARGIMATTRRAETSDAYQRDPLILALTSPRGQSVRLVIRDVAGEDLENPAPDETYLGYFARADSVLFLFDPSAVGEVRELLQDYLPRQDREVGDPARVLENLLRLLGPSSVPVGMILSKFDTMQALSFVQDHRWRRVMSNAGAAFARDPGIFGLAYNLHDGDLLHEEVRSLLALLHAQSFTNALAPAHQRQPREHRFFAVSALGDSVVGDRLHPRGIAPFRCLDPVRWALARSEAL